MFTAMEQSYESGAEYVVVFNYQGEQSAQGGNSASSTNCLLQTPQFFAIQKFWTNVVKSAGETNNVKAQDTLVLPADFGSSMGNPGAGMWGMWSGNNTSDRVLNALQLALVKYGSKLDVVIDDPTYPVAGRYQHVIYWNQTT